MPRAQVSVREKPVPSRGEAAEEGRRPTRERRNESQRSGRGGGRLTDTWPPHRACFPTSAVTLSAKRGPGPHVAAKTPRCSGTWNWGVALD